MQFEPMDLRPRVDVRRERIHILLLSVAFAAVPILSLAVQLPLSFLFGGMTLSGTWQVLLLWGLGCLPMYAVAMPLSRGMLCFCEGKAPPVGERWTVARLLGTSALAVSLSLVGGMLYQRLMQLLRWLPSHVTDSAVNDMALSSPLWMLLLFSVVLAPLFEEWMYRKVLLDRLTRYGTVPAMLASGLLFGLIHGNLQQLCSTVPVGILLSYVYLRTGRLTYTVVIHALHNALGGVIPTLLQRASVQLPAYEGTWNALYLCLLLLCLGFAVPTVRMLWRERRVEHALFRVERGDALAILLWNPGVWFLAVTLAVFFVL